jgi:hypothetical protein
MLRIKTVFCPKARLQAVFQGSSAPIYTAGAKLWRQRVLYKFVRRQVPEPFRGAAESMDYKDWIIVLATLTGPILAVQAQKAVEALRDRRARKERVFAQLMATRAARLSPEHVQALNMIDIVFYGSSLFGVRRRSKQEQVVLDAWKEYHDNLSEGDNWPEAQQQAHWAKREELFLNLLYAVAQDVGFSFDRVQLKRGAYTPVAHEELELEQRALRRALIGSFSGESPLKMEVMRMPVNEQLVAEYRENVARIATALEKGLPNVEPSDV